MINYWRFFVIVKEKTSVIVERFGKYHKQLDPGFHFLVPVMDNIAYRQPLKEEAIAITEQTAITKDNVTVHIDGTLFIQIMDPFKASYKVEKPFEAIKLLALTVLRSEIGKMKLDKLFQERAEINGAINMAVNKACSEWGLNCLRYEILNIDPPIEIKQSMQYEAEAERLKRREILISEGKQQAKINISSGEKIALIKKAEGMAESLKVVSQKEAEGIESIAAQLKKSHNAEQIVTYLLTKNYIKNYQKTLKKSNLVVTPQGQGGKSSELVTMAALSMFQRQNPTGKFDPELIESYMKQFNNKKNSSQQNSADTEHNYQEILQKMQYFDDPLLYGDPSQQQQDSYGSFKSSKKDQIPEEYDMDEYNEKSYLSDQNSPQNTSSYNNFNQLNNTDSIKQQDTNSQKNSSY